VDPSWEGVLDHALDVLLHVEGDLARFLRDANGAVVVKVLAEVGPVEVAAELRDVTADEAFALVAP